MNLVGLLLTQVENVCGKRFAENIRVVETDGVITPLKRYRVKKPVFLVAVSTLNPEDENSRVITRAIGMRM